MSSDVALSIRTVVGTGDSSILVEPRGASIRIKARGRPEFFVPMDVAPALADALRGLATQAARARA